MDVGCMTVCCPSETYQSKRYSSPLNTYIEKHNLQKQWIVVLYFYYMVLLHSVKTFVPCKFYTWAIQISQPKTVQKYHHQTWRFIISMAVNRVTPPIVASQHQDNAGFPLLTPRPLAMPARSASGVGLETDRRGGQGMVVTPKGKKRRLRQKSQPLHQSFGAEGSAFHKMFKFPFVVSFGSEIFRMVPWGTLTMVVQKNTVPCLYIYMHMHNHIHIYVLTVYQINHLQAATTWE